MKGLKSRFGDIKHIDKILVIDYNIIERIFKKKCKWGNNFWKRKTPAVNCESPRSGLLLRCL